MMYLLVVPNILRSYVLPFTLTPAVDFLVRPITVFQGVQGALTSDTVEATSMVSLRVINMVFISLYSISTNVVDGSSFKT